MNVAFHHLKGDKNMENKTKMTVTFSRYEYDLLIAEEYPDGSVKGEFAIVNTPSGITMEKLAEMIADIDYELRVA